MKKLRTLATLFALALCCGLAGAQLSYTPPAIAAYWFNTPNWNPFTGTGAGQALSYVPPAYGMYYQDTGTKLWYPCNQNGCGGGSGPTFAYPLGTGIVRVSGGSAWGTTAELSGDATTSGSNAVTVKGINGTALSGLATGPLCNTTTTGVPSACGGNSLNAPNYIAGGGTAQAQTATLSPAIAALVAGQTNFCFLPNAANTSAAPTLAVNGLTATAITKVPNNAALVANDLITTAPACVIYDGTQFELQNPQTTASGGGLTFPYTILQADSAEFSGSTSFTYTLPATSQASGATMEIDIGGDASGGAMAVPTASPGTVAFTCTVNVASGSQYPRLMVCLLASASYTSISITTPAAAAPTVLFREYSGTRSFDQNTPLYVSGSKQNVVFPSITPTAGAAVFGLCTFVLGGPYPPVNSLGLGTGWNLIQVSSSGISNVRALAGYAYTGTATGAAITPPILSINNGPLTASGISCSSYSIK